MLQTASLTEAVNRLYSETMPKIFECKRDESFFKIEAFLTYCAM